MNAHPELGPDPETAFVFTGQGSQQPRMTVGLYNSSPVYRRYLEQADAALRPGLDRSVIDFVRNADPLINRTGYAQPVLFAIGYALGATLRDLGVLPGLLLGHSIGELAAAVLGGGLGLSDAARLVTARAQGMELLPEGGGMLAVKASEAEVLELIAAHPLIGTAAVNSRAEVVLSGDADQLMAIREQLAGHGISATRLRVSHAFHSPLMAPMLADFGAVARTVDHPRATTALVSTVLGRLLSADELSADYWVRHISATVRFADGVDALMALGATRIVEIGPRPVLSRLLEPLVQQHGIQVFNACRGPAGTADQLAALAAELTAGRPVAVPA
ncbi:acyltransferase domain-containing protein [Kitasatospora sp. NBC_01287]|uniref:acyltransferase domain-containing protein n=1 Tax=Kitasatospora sp. NBC_01287 TaxID=2903573 RepID=UPI0022500048|nr:acyltransferase domain-containing protein [Kitasatospora sp. NBC_01287]MCX4748874.1 acyltransferase domain-containing protein [Kitasatospora sp. NBC_01287]